MAVERSLREQQDDFIDALLDAKLNYKTACQAVGLHRNTLRAWLQNDEEFKKRLNRARLEFKVELEAEGYKRALHGDGKLLMEFLAAIDPETYDSQIRKAKWLKDQGMDDPDAVASITINLRKGPLPERVRKEREKESSGPDEGD